MSDQTLHIGSFVKMLITGSISKVTNLGCFTTISRTTLGGVEITDRIRWDGTHYVGENPRERYVVATVEDIQRAELAAKLILEVYAETPPLAGTVTWTDDPEPEAEEWEA
jgi:hypothetical protein